MSRRRDPFWGESSTESNGDWMQAGSQWRGRGYKQGGRVVEVEDKPAHGDPSNRSVSAVRREDVTSAGLLEWECLEGRFLSLVLYYRTMSLFKTPVGECLLSSRILTWAMCIFPPNLTNVYHHFPIRVSRRTFVVNGYQVGYLPLVLHSSCG